jgi:very-short-patch-repair endonuclease
MVGGSIILIKELKRNNYLEQLGWFKVLKFCSREVFNNMAL